jgi:hypothetical protein
MSDLDKQTHAARCGAAASSALREQSGSFHFCVTTTGSSHRAAAHAFMHNP